MICLTVSFDPPTKEGPFKSHQTQETVQKGEEKSCGNSRSELFGAIDRSGHH